MRWDGTAMGGVGLTAGIYMRSPPKPSKNQYWRGVVTVLLHVGITAYELSNPPVVLREFLRGNPSNPQSTPPQPMICGRYTPPKTDVLPFMGRGPHSSCVTAGGGGILTYIFASRNLLTSTLACVHK